VGAILFFIFIAGLAIVVLFPVSAWLGIKIAKRRRARRLSNK
jgi:hypothetical protein